VRDRQATIWSLQFSLNIREMAATLLSNQTIQVRNTPGGTFKPGPFGANTAVPRTSQNVVPSSLQVDGGVAFVVREDELPRSARR
jgi:hypothetical protein